MEVFAVQFMIVFSVIVVDLYMAKVKVAVDVGVSVGEDVDVDVDGFLAVGKKVLDN